MDLENQNQIVLVSLNDLTTLMERIQKVYGGKYPGKSCRQTRA
jgi:hypothetical protein